MSESITEKDVSPEEQIEKLDQEITLNLQKIDSNLGYCFKIITQGIIPSVRNYSEICDNIMDSSNWLTTMFQQTGNVNLYPTDASIPSVAATKANTKKDSIFPESNNDSSSPSSREQNLEETYNNDISQDFHTANITSTGQILKVPDSSDEENENNVIETTDTGIEGNESTIQRQSRKRKISLLLQQEYGSSSSAMPSPVAISNKKTTSINTSTGGSTGRVMDSSPLRNNDDK